MRIKRYLGVLTAALWSVSLLAGTIRVRTQADFDAMPERVRGELEAGEKRIEVRFEQGRYRFSEDHLRLEYPDAAGVSLVLDGGGAILTGAGEGTPSAGNFPPGLCQVVRKARSFVEPAGQGRWRIRMRGADNVSDLNEADCQGLYVIVTQWYRSGCYPVREIRGGSVYFDSEESLSELNLDFRYGRSFPKYMFVHDPVRKQAARFLTLWGGELGNLGIKNFQFIGNGGKDYLIQLFQTVVDSVEVTGCRFEALQDRALSTHFIRNVSFHDNVIVNCYRLTLYVDMFSPGARIFGNTFRNNGLAFEGQAVMESLGEDMHVHDNVFEDFTYAGIITGIHFTNDNPVSTSGVIERNEFYMTEAFRKEPSRTLMDCGAIYIGTMNKDLTVRNNYVHDFIGSKDYRGIFGDDGASNVQVYGNLVLNVGAPYCIDFRRVEEVEKRPDSHARRVNVGNRIYGNTVDGPVRFERRGGDDGCYKGKDTLVRTETQKRQAVQKWRRGLKSRE